MRKILSYCKSHIYDIHSVLVGIILLLIFFLIREKVKKLISQQIDDRIKKNPQLISRRSAMLRVWYLRFLVVLLISAILGFAVLAQISPFVEFSLQSGLMGCVYTLCGIAFLKQIFPNEPPSKDERAGDI